MIHRQFNLNRPLKVVVYLRMSSDTQNPRSPDQQLETIRAIVERLKLPWTIVAVYTDAGVSGRYVRKRQDFQKMLAQLRSGEVVADAVLVDTFERFGRNDEVAGIRDDLRKRHGILVLTADTQFADPTTVGGRAMAMFESFRATEDNRVKSHTVLRGKKDAVLLKHWPGGPAPFGYRLRSVMTEVKGPLAVSHRVLEADPESAFIIVRAYELAGHQGLGSSRVTRALNLDSTVPKRFKPFNEQTVYKWLGHEIYKGEMLWPRCATDIVDDHRVRQAIPENERLRIPDYCQALVPVALWDLVAQMRRARRNRCRIAPLPDTSMGEKAFAPLVPGISIKYLLAGLVRCGHCGLAMVPASSSPYVTAAGEVKRYVYFHCPDPCGGCDNDTYIREDWLRETVLELVRTRLLRA